ncbi:MAG: sugar phosphate isomerase/epimerase [Oscillospiraceae bacterium]|nr:sugar phosphate isomerase/epimerase [Oscillospiraceae bacterium]
MLPKLGFSLQKEYGRPWEDVIRLLHDVGFSAVSPIFCPEADLQEIDRCVRRYGMTIQSLHAPNRVAPLWEEEGSADTLEKMLACIDTCAAYQIPIMVLHSWNGLLYTFPGEPLYYNNFDRIVDYAQQRDISIAFENLEGEEYLAALMARYADRPHVGFCWDSGHEHCYPHKLDFLKLFGDRLIMTHLNDNLGPRIDDGVGHGEDDLHYLPWDGNIDWEKNLQRLYAAKEQKILNFELKIRSNSDDPKDLIYVDLPLEEFLQQAAARAIRLAEEIKR